MLQTFSGVSGGLQGSPTGATLAVVDAPPFAPPAPPLPPALSVVSVVPPTPRAPPGSVLLLRSPSELQAMHSWAAANADNKTENVREYLLKTRDGILTPEETLTNAGARVYGSSAKQ